jgi:hypothetical protein
LGYRQIKLSSKDYLDGVPTRGVSPKCTFMSFGLTNTFCLVPTTYESIFLEYHDNLVVEPINDTLALFIIEEIHIEHLALVLETCKNHLCVVTMYVFWMFEVAFFGSRVFAKRCHCGSK